MNAGTILAGRYRLVSLLGRGGMGEVWRAEHLGLNAPVAVKLMGPEFAASAEALQRFNREAQSAAALRSPHVVQILDHGVDPESKSPFIAMELMEGETLAHRIGRAGSLSLAETARVVTHVARALSRAHEAGVVHRDLKPDNIFLVRNEDEEIAKVLDFGIAKVNTQSLSGDVATRTGAVMGTPYYMSPEQIGGSKSVDHRTDLWALGVIACECATGRRPFDADTIGGLVLAICTAQIPAPSSLGPVASGFDAWAARALERDPARRFQSARELADALRTALAAAGTGAGFGAPVPNPSGLLMVGPGAAPTGSAPLQPALATGGATAHTNPGALPLTQAKPSSRAPLFAVLGVVVAAGIGLALFKLRGNEAAVPVAEPSADAAAAGSTGARVPPPPVVTPAPSEVAPSVVEAAAPSGVAATPTEAPLAAPSASPAPARVAPPKTPASARPKTPAPKPAAPKPAAPQAPADSSIFDRRKG
jgi:eukaryotic-like serine/threonine-protein kinase